MSASYPAGALPAAGVRRLLLTSPVGPLLAEYDADALRVLRFWPQGAHPPAGTRDEPAPGDALGRRVADQLREYFAGTRREFDLPLAPGGTAFQARVWQALRSIPYGASVSYARVAAQVGTQNARAVGQANARNPIPIIIPCHRVVTADGRPGGFMGEGPDGDGAQLKRWLLAHEGVLNLEF